MLSSQLIYALILSVHLIAPQVTGFDVEVLEAGRVVDTITVTRRAGVYRYHSVEQGELLFEAERSGLYGQFFLVFEPGTEQPVVVDLVEAFEELSRIPVARDRIDVLEWRLRRGRGVVYLEMPDIATILAIHSEAVPHGWVLEPPREPWAR